MYVCSSSSYCNAFTALLQVSSIKGLIGEALQAQFFTRQKQVVQVVVYNLPDRDCSAKASDGEFHLSDDGLAKYKKFIDCMFELVVLWCVTYGVLCSRCC